jgi:hypothetical protein
MVIVHEIVDEEDFDAQIIDDYTTDDGGEYYEECESDNEGNRKQGSISFITNLIPSKLRSRLSIWSSRALSASAAFAKMAGKAAWILTTSLLLVGLPLLYAYDREKSLVEYEKEQQRFTPPVASQ